MKIPLFYIDAFTSEAFKGNPAAVCMLDSWLPDESLQDIASQHNLSETAFVVKNDKNVFQLKWFTPTTEVNLCGHATLATAYVLFSIYNFGKKPIEFNTKSGKLEVAQEKDGKLTLNFPVYDIQPYNGGDLGSIFGSDIVEICQSRDLIVRFQTSKAVETFMPNFEKLKKLPYHGVIITAQGSDSDFVSRYFAPAVGVNEDPVTGSAHCSLTPFWSKRLNKTEMFARQLSKRSGEIWCKLNGNRVFISGFANSYMQGTINVSIKPPSNLVQFS
jgi:PhzF family phenazine biosynthesis protein